MTNKVYYTNQDVKSWCSSIIRAMTLDQWMPDYVVGLTRGGLVPANMISQYLDVPMETLKVKLRDHADIESNLWMANDAFGSNDEDGLKILIVDDINDSGATLNWICQDWQNSCLPKDERWINDVWGKNVRFAVLINNEASKFNNINYAGKTINKFENPEWCVFPWENWWE